MVFASRSGKGKIKQLAQVVPPCPSRFFCGALRFLGYGAIGSGVGLGVGTILGAPSRDRWEEVPLDRLRVSFAPKRDGFEVGLSVAF